MHFNSMDCAKIGLVPPLPLRSSFLLVIAFVTRLEQGTNKQKKSKNVNFHTAKNVPNQAMLCLLFLADF